MIYHFVCASISWFHFHLGPGVSTPSLEGQRWVSQAPALRLLWWLFSHWQCINECRVWGPAEPYSQNQSGARFSSQTWVIDPGSNQEMFVWATLEKAFDSSCVVGVYRIMTITSSPASSFHKWPTCAWASSIHCLWKHGLQGVWRGLRLGLLSVSPTHRVALLEPSPGAAKSPWFVVASVTSSVLHIFFSSFNLVWQLPSIVQVLRNLILSSLHNRNGDY